MNTTKMPERIWATLNGMSTRLPDGKRQFIGGWSEDPKRDRDTPYVRADLAKEAMEAGEAVLTYANQTTELGRVFKVNGEFMERLEAALSKLKEAGL